MADILDAQAMAGFLDGDIAGGIDAFDRVARMFVDIGNLLRVITPRSTRGHGLVFAGRAADALADTSEAVELARSLGYPDGETYALWHHSEALSACGRTAEATESAELALSIARRLRHRGWTATALRALGIARQADGDLAAAEEAYRRSLRASERLPLFVSWAHARLGAVLVRAGRVDETARHVEAALGTGPRSGTTRRGWASAELGAAEQCHAGGRTTGPRSQWRGSAAGRGGARRRGGRHNRSFPTTCASCS